MGPGGALHNSSVSNSINVRTVEFTIGAPGVSGCDHNFTSAANTNEQSIQMGGTTIIPANSPITSIVAKCIDTVNPSMDCIIDMGKNIYTDEYISSIDLNTADEIQSVSAQVVPEVAASSVYFSATPSANWNTMNTGKWKVWITFNDNSIL